MTLLAPWFLVAGAAAAALAAALHLLARDRPRRAALPTARFVPDVSASAASLAPQPRDRLLLAVRVLALLVAAAALAHPLFAVRRRTVARVVIVDRSRAIGSAREAADSAHALLRDGDVLVLFDSAAHPVQQGAADSLQRLALREATGSLSAALIAAMRAGSSIRQRADSVEIALISPFVAEELDSATLGIRRLWPGGIRLVRIAVATRAGGVPAAIELRGAADDPLRATLALAGRVGAPAGVRIVRDAVTTADSSWARLGGVLVEWGGSGKRESGSGNRNSGSGKREAGNGNNAPFDTVGAVVVRGVPVVAEFVRDTGAVGGRAVAWWVDGRVAAAESTLGSGCVREVRIPLPDRGDFVLREGAARLLSGLTAPCGMPRFQLLGDSVLRLLRGDAGAASAAALPAPPPGRDRLPLILLAVSAVLLLAEPWLRKERAA